MIYALRDYLLSVHSTWGPEQDWQELMASRLCGSPSP